MCEVNALSKDYIGLFSDYLIYERHYSELTNKAYRDDVRHFQTFLNDSGDDDLLKVTVWMLESILVIYLKVNIVAQAFHARFRVFEPFINFYYKII